MSRNDTSAGEGPDFANSSRFHSAPFQRQPVNRSTGPRFHACRAVAWRRRVHSVTPSQIVEERLPRCRERVSFRQVPSAGRPRIRALPKLPPSRRPQNQSDHWPVRASRWPYACPPARRRRPPSHPTARSRNIAAPHPAKGQRSLRSIPAPPVTSATGPRFHSAPFHRLKSPKTGCPGAVSA